MGTEIWKSVIDFEDRYQISNKGNVKSLIRPYGSCSYASSKELVLQGVINRGGYVDYALSREGKRMRISAHRLVAMHFIDNPENKPCVNHVNGNKKDNSVENLEWVTFAENSRHAVDSGLLRYDTPVMISNKKRFRKMITGNTFGNRSVINTRTGEVFNSIKEASAAMDVSANTISNELTGRVKNRVLPLQYVNK